MKRQKSNAVEVSKDEEQNQWRVTSGEWRERATDNKKSGVMPACAGRPRSTERVDAKLVWIQLEDQVVPRLGLTAIERTVYAHLVRHSRLEGKLSLRFSIRWLARNVGLSTGPVRGAVRRLIAQGALRLVQRSKTGHVVEVLVPEEIPAERPNAIESQAAAGEDGAGAGAAVNIEEADFTQNAALRNSIHAREGGKCFYCLRRTSTAVQCLDHVVPLARSGSNSYCNLVSCCLECNSQKGEKPAHDFLRWLYREGHLNSSELAGRIRALDDLAAGKLRPAVQEVRK